MTEPAPAALLLAPKWQGQPGRMEVWYATLTDASTGLGLWVHHEVVASTRGAGRLHGWAAAFPPDGEPVWDRFEPAEVLAADLQSPIAPGRLSGTTERLAWDLEWQPRGETLFTFPRWAWTTERLPAAQIVPAPGAAFSGTATVRGRSWPVSGTGAVARIYGRGNAQQWCWLHGDLGDGEIIEVVAATSRHRGLDRLRPLPFIQVRFGGRDWPARPELAAPLFRCRPGLPTWTVAGTSGRRRLRVNVTIPPERSVSIRYEDPDGSTATCVNSEVADAEILLEHWRRGWQPERSWTLVGRAHAEVGSRP